MHWYTPRHPLHVLGLAFSGAIREPRLLESAQPRKHPIARLMCVAFSISLSLTSVGSSDATTRVPVFYCNNALPAVPPDLLRRSGLAEVATYLAHTSKARLPMVAEQAWIAGRKDVLDLLGSAGVRIKPDQQIRFPRDEQIRNAWIALMNVSSKSEPKEVEELLARFVDPLLDEALCDELFYRAEENLRFDYIRLLLKRGASFNIPASQGPAAATAANAIARGDVATLRQIDAAALVRTTDTHGRNLLCLAVLAGAGDEMIDYLLEKGVDPISSATHGSALALAGYTAGPSIIDKLFKAGQTSPRLMISASSSLHHAIEAGNLSAIDTLLHKGTPLESMLTFASSQGNVQAASMLLDRGASVDERTVQGATPLMAAAGNGSKELIGLLLSRGADVNAVDTGNKTPLIWAAAAQCREEAIRMLLDAGADAGVSTTQYYEKYSTGSRVRDGGFRALDWAIAWGSVATVRLLLEKGIAWNHRLTVMEEFHLQLDKDLQHRSWGEKPMELEDTPESSSVPLEQLLAVPNELDVHGKQYTLSVNWYGRSDGRHPLSVQVALSAHDGTKDTPRVAFDRIWVIRENWIWESSVQDRTSANKGPFWGPYLIVDVVARLRLPDGTTRMIRLTDQEIIPAS